MISHLAKIRDLTVISRTSMLAYSRAPKGSLKKIADELGVAALLEGSVRRAGNKVRVAAQLIDARTDAHIWNETYEKDLSDVFAVQSALAQEIAGALKASLTANERALIQRQLTRSQEAYDFYLRAVSLHTSLSYRAGREKFDQVVALLDQAVARDPAFLLPHAYGAQVHARMYSRAMHDATLERSNRARVAMEAAQRLAPRAPETRAAQGNVAGYCDGDWSRALTEFKAIEVEAPNYPQLLHSMGGALWRLGRWQEGVSYYDRSIALDPHNLAVGSGLMAYTMMLRRYPMFRQLAERYLARFPDDPLVQQFVVRSRYAIDGDRPAYLQSRAAVAPMDDDPHGLVKAYQMAICAGDLPAAARILDDPQLKTLSNQRDNRMQDPRALHQALVASLRGQRNAAQAFADTAIVFFQSGNWTPQQQPLARLGIAQAHAYAGREDKAVRELQAVMAAVVKNPDATRSVRFEAPRIYAAIDRRDEALDALRELLRGPCYSSPNELRFDPLLARLKDDPRFEEILQSAKAL